MHSLVSFCRAKEGSTPKIWHGKQVWPFVSLWFFCVPREWCFFLVFLPFWFFANMEKCCSRKKDKRCQAQFSLNVFDEATQNEVINYHEVQEATNCTFYVHHYYVLLGRDKACYWIFRLMDAVNGMQQFMFSPKTICWIFNNMTSFNKRSKIYIQEA